MLLKRKPLKLKDLYTFFGILLYKIACDYSYSHIISVLFEYQNFRNIPTTFTVFFSWSMVLVLTPLMIKTFNKEDLSSSIVTILILVSLIPTSSLIAYDSTYDIKYLILMFMYWSILLLANLYIPAIVMAKSVSFTSKYIYVVISLLLCTTVIYVSWKFTGFRFHFGLYDVYELRAEARGFEAPLLVSYLSTFSDNLLPVLLVYFLYKKQHIFALVIGGVIMLNYGITATKQILFLLFLSLIGFYLVRSFKIIKLYIWAFLLLLCICISEYLLFNTYFFSIFSIYRIFFIPAKLHYVYYDFFSTRELDYFRQSVLKFFFTSPYKENIGFLLGDYDIGDITARANNGLFSDAYMNFGVLGVLIFPIIVSIILKTLDGATKGLSQRILFIVTSSVAFVLLGLPFSTALLSAGIILLIFFLYTLPRESRRVIK